MIWFFLRIALIFVVIFILMSTAKSLARRIFNIEKVSEDSPSRNYVKQLHQEVDKPFINYSLVILFVVLVVDLVYFPESYNLFIVTVLVFTFIRMLIRAFFEWKYSKYPKQFFLTLTEIVILLAAVIVVAKFNLLY
ncbi:DUF4181 domain-containing protein [Sporosarcina sp. Marseille-Q4063]|uniref:DUF4181 domain-containing protein n=1 Tax=Sporosarcina sp. Marseille-Q4063 TaxID=2810514 RepID=UPI001BB03C2F|nr:DUF4181 domain-containing protein [Sporosarcina sp. Marseille-Q4063]QUW22684.1 DUF4181 domain-containing protein [Sporosarcina sp. Marseille-Q4063]